MPRNYSVVELELPHSMTEEEQKIYFQKLEGIIFELHPNLISLKIKQFFDAGKNSVNSLIELDQGESL